MSGSPLITICIVSWNRSDCVIRAVTSVLNKFPSDAFNAILVLDNGSIIPYSIPDFRKIHPLVRVVRTESNLGAAVGRNRLLEEVDTPYVLFLDDDCYFCSDPTLDLLVEYFEADESLAVVTANIWEKEATGRVQLRTPSKLRKRPSASRRFELCFGFIGGCFLAHVAKLKSVGGFPTTGLYGCEELAVSHRLFARGYRFGRSSHLEVVHLPEGVARLPLSAYFVSHMSLRLAIGIVYFRGLPRISHVMSTMFLFAFRYLQSAFSLRTNVFVPTLRSAISTERFYSPSPIGLRNVRKLRLLGLRGWT